jgi:hypothetical protein
MGEAVRVLGSEDWGAELWFAYPEVFLIPVEHQSSDGMHPAFAHALRERRGVSEAWLELFDQALTSYFERVAALTTAAPRYWRAPRLANLCIVQDANRTRPYCTPFSKSSLVLYASDFDPECSNLEHAVYQLVHAERLSLTGDVGMTWIHNLGYFLMRTPEEREAFAIGCSTSPRPDAHAFRALAERMGLVESLHHDELSPGPAPTESSTARVELAGLTVLAEHQAEFQTVAKTFLAVAHDVMQRHFEAQRSGGDGSSDQELVEWLAESAPMVLLADHFGGTLWDPDRPEEVGAIRAVVDGIPSGAARSLIEDWSVIDAHTTRFLDALADPDELVPPGESLDQEDGIYVHADRKIIAYCLAQPGFKTLAEEAPPFHRMLVGARTVHELGHLAADAGIVRVPEHLKDAHENAHQKVLAIFDRIVADAAEVHRGTAEREVELLRREGYRLGDMPLQRVSDYQANLLARAFLSAGEMEAYIRANVRSLIDEEEIGPYLRLARYAYEYQYLTLSRMDDPFDYLLSCTWFAEDLIEPGIVTEDRARELFDAVATLFACYEIDTTRIRLPE